MSRVRITLGAIVFVASACILYLASRTDPEATEKADEQMNSGGVGRTERPSVPSVEPSARREHNQHLENIPRQSTAFAGAAIANAAELRSIYERGILSSADEYAKFSALRIGEYCLSAVTRNQQPEIPNTITGETVRQSNESKRNLNERCASFYSIPLNQLQEQLKILNQAIEMENSKFSQSYGQLSRINSNELHSAAKKNLIALYNEFGTEALFWTSGTLAGHLIQKLESIANSEGNKSEMLAKRVDNASIVAMCVDKELCGKTSLVYLSICATTFLCGNSIDSHILDSLDDSERDATIQLAKIIIQSIQDRRYVDLGLEAAR